MNKQVTKQINMLKFLLIFLLAKCAFGANILFIGGIPSPSNQIFNGAYVFGLAEKGHNVTMISNDLEKKKHENFNQILFEGVYEAMHTDFDINGMIYMNPLRSAYEIWEFADFVCQLYFKTDGLRRLMDYPKDFKFDLIVFDNTVGECLYPLIDRFNKPPAIAITPFHLAPYLANGVGSHLYPSYYPHYCLRMTNKMTFFERVQNFLLTYGDTLYRDHIFVHRQHENMKKYFGENTRTFVEYERDLILLLSNTDPILDYPLPLPPNIIPVGGMHIKPAQPLPEDLEKIMDEAEHGVVYFSLGTNIQAHLLGPEIRDEFLAAFAKLKETVIWKYETEIPNLPKNVIVKKWLPQSDILGHPKCKLFISHSGGLSSQEAVYHGVPIVGIPGFLDQHKNIHRTVHKGLGLRLSFDNIKRDVVYEVVKEVLDNPKYAEKVKETSRKYRDQLQTPLERAIFWTEYVLRHKRADELSLPARDMYFYQTSNLDVVLFLIFGFTSFLFVVYKFLAMVCSCSKKQKLKKH